LFYKKGNINGRAKPFHMQSVISIGEKALHSLQKARARLFRIWKPINGKDVE
jgi:hypothetical protein